MGLPFTAALSGTQCGNVSRPHTEPLQVSLLQNKSEPGPCTPPLLRTVTRRPAFSEALSPGCHEHPPQAVGRVNLVHWHPNGPSEGVVRNWGGGGGGVVLQLWLHAGAPPAVSALGACTAASPASSPSVHHRSQLSDKRCSRLPNVAGHQTLQQGVQNRVGVVQRPAEPPAASQLGCRTAQHGTALRSTARIDRDSGRGRLIAHSHRKSEIEWQQPPAQSGAVLWLLRRAASCRSSASAALRNQMVRRSFPAVGTRCCAL